jgi:hypothetical protein
MDVHRLLRKAAAGPVLDYLGTLLDRPGHFETALRFALERRELFADHDAFVRYCIDLPQVVSQTVDSIGIVADAAERLGLAEQFELSAQRIIERGDRPLVWVGNNVSAQTARGKAVSDRLKYGDDPTDLNEFELGPRAESLARRLRVDDDVLRFLYRKSGRSQKFGGWATSVRYACALEEVTRDALRYRVDLLTYTQPDPTFFDVSRVVRPGEMILVNHGGFMNPKLVYFLGHSEGVVFSSKPKEDSRFISAKASPRAALLAGYKAISGGKSMYIGIDAKNGGAFTPAKVLGVRVQLGSGAAFMAYESRCPVSWFGMRWNGSIFVPWKCEGPQRGPSDNLQTYTQRFMDFYVAQLERYFTSDPGNMSLLPFWVGRFLSALEGD